jgi:glycosyltransferase involved in cell wall biosynthesis
MHLFVIPSWYPHRCYPLEGAYIRDQATTMADLRPDWHVSIARWGQGAAFLSLAHLLHSPRCTLDLMMLPRLSENPLAPNLVEWIEVTPTWSERFAGGNRHGLLRTMRRLIGRAREQFGLPDLLHAHVSYPGGWLAWQLSQELGIPYVVTEHMGPFPLPVYRTNDEALREDIREPLAHAAARIAVSPSLAQRIESFGLAPVEPVPNFIDERRYHTERRPGDGRFCFFTVCGMEHSKGIADLIEAIALLLPRLGDERRQQVTFRVGGEGPAWREFQNQARARGVSEWIEWLGLLPHEVARNEFAACDCFVLPSHHESFGIVFVEAQASGRPAIGTRSGGPESIVTPDAGVLVEPHRPDELARALEWMIDHAHEFDADRLRAQCISRYGRAAVVDQLDRIYQRVLATHVTAAPARRTLP